MSAVISECLQRKEHCTSEVPSSHINFFFFLTCSGSDNTCMTSDRATGTALVTLNHSIQEPSASLLHDPSRLGGKKKIYIYITFIYFCDFLISEKAVQHLQNTFPKEITVQAKFKYPIIDCMCFILSSFHYNALSTIADRFFQSSSGSPK